MVVHHATMIKRAKAHHNSKNKARANEAGRPNLSEVLLIFAKPLLDSLPNPPPTLEQVRLAMHLASIVWNLPLLAKDDPSFGNDVCASLDDVPPELGPHASKILDLMLESRNTTFADDPRFASVEVVETKEGWTVRTRSAVVP